MKKDYYIQANTNKSEQIKYTFEKLGYNVGLLAFTSGLYYTLNGNINITDIGSNEYYLVINNPNYEELKLKNLPKYKVGDWVVYNGASVWQVYRIDRNMCIPRYELTNNDGDKLSVPFTSEYNLKEWSIQDAKIGDILTASDKSIFMYAGLTGVLVQSYIALLADGDLNTMKCNWEEKTSVSPATKEQFGLLFAKMKEAGYEWDVEKKELKKIQPHYDIKNLKPFQKVLVRDSNRDKWRCAWFSDYDKKLPFSFITTGADYKQCIPFEGNETLLGTTDMCDECYINW